MNNSEEPRPPHLGRQFSDATFMMHAAIAQKAGLTGTDHKYLGFLIENGPMTAGELGRHTGLTSGAVTGLVDRLVLLKLVRRAYDEEDRRKIYIEPQMEVITRKLGPIFGELQARMQGIQSAFSSEDLDVVGRYMQACIDEMKSFTAHLREPVIAQSSK